MAQEIDDLLSKVDDTSFVEDDWNVVFDECSPLASKWQLLSTYLGLKLSIVDRIKSDFSGDSLGCWNEALKEWIKMNYNTEKFGKPSWKTLLKAIAKIDKLQFNRLATKHQASTKVHQTTKGTMPNPGEASDTGNAIDLLVFAMLSSMVAGLALGKSDFGMGMAHGVAGASTENELHLASGRGDLKKVKELIEEKQFDPLQKEGQFGVNALHYSAQYGQLQVLSYFVEERGCSPASQDKRAWTPLHYAAYGKHLNIVHYLITEQQTAPLCCADDGTTPLHAASQGGDVNVVRYLVNELSRFLPLKDIVTSRGCHGSTPIHLAAFCGHLEIIEYFINELDCDPNIDQPVEYQGRTTRLGGRIALHDAAQQGHLHIVKYLVEQCNCDSLHLDSERVTPLHMAAQCGHLEIVQYLTQEQHCDPLCTNKKNDTPLHDAARNGHLQLVRFFVDVLHCSPDVRGQLNTTPLEQACSQGHRHVVQYLESIHPKLQ